MGITRFLLAIAVVGAHTGSEFSISGRAAVTIFYLISGFLMTLILNGTYKDNIGGFYTNRLLRLAIPYWVVLMVVVIAYTVLEVEHPALSDLSWDLKLVAWFTSVFIVGSDWLWLLGLDQTQNITWAPVRIGSNPTTLSQFSLVPPIFTVALEIYFYAFAPILVIGLKRSWMFLYLSLSYYVLVSILELSGLAWSYHFPLAPFVYFAFGAVICHLSVLSNMKLTHKDYWLFLLACIVYAFGETVIPFTLLFFALFAIPALFNISNKNSIDKYVGNYSYPVYLLHFPVMTVLVSQGIEPEHLFIYTMAVTLFFSFLLHHLVEHPIEKIRSRIRSRHI